MKKMLRTAAALLLSGCMMVAPALAATTSFTDVPNDQGINYYVLQAAKEGLVAGVGGGKFGMGQKVTNAEFATMVCKLFYNTEATAYHNTYKDTYKATDWWRPFLAVAYTKGLLNNTVMGISRATNNSWAQSIVEQPISRYDMAQVMLNVANVQGWSNPSAQAVLDAQAKIGDWKNIPGKYQAAVASAYAKGFLSGMQDGTFSGGNSMLREQSAVVLCRMADAKAESGETEDPSFTNTTDLVNGKQPSEKNVVSALTELKKDYPTGYIWNVNKSYRSPELGTSTGGSAFVYMISDQVFGNLEVNAAAPEDLKAGDMIFVHAENSYVLVEEVDGENFTYVSCNSSGRVTWGKQATIGDIGSKDTVYTRYEVEDDEVNTLSNGKSATTSNVEKLIEDFFDEEYADGDAWDYSYRSTHFGSERVYEGEAFAYYFSDYVFGELAVKDVDDFDDLRVGDVICWDDYEEYIVVTAIDGDIINYAGVYNEKVYTEELDVDQLDSVDFAYTRYPENVVEDDEVDSLSNGKRATASNVEKLIEDFFDEEYTDGDEWDYSYKSANFSSGRVYESEAFAYYFSDYIFGELAVKDVDDFEELCVGDVIYWDDYEEYIVVTAIDGDTIDYVGVYNEKVYTDDLDVDQLGSDDFAYTRYP